MSNETKTEVKKEVLEFEIDDKPEEKSEVFHPDLLDDDVLGEIMPTMDTNPLAVPPEQKCIIEDQKLLDLYDELLDQGRQDRKQAQELVVNFEDMVINDGDATSSSKEALVALVKLKSDITDKMSKIADLMTRHTLKDRNTFQPYLANHTHTHSNVTIEASNSKRDILKKLESKKKKQGDK